MSEDHAPELGAGGGREVERLIFFSDAVMAIAITLLVIDLRLPETLEQTATAADLRAALEGLGPRFLSVALSFMVIAVWWVGHNRLFRSLSRADGRLVLLNFVFLAAIVFLPFPTAVIGRFVDLSPAVILYAATNVVAGTALLLMRRHADRRGFIPAETAAERRLRLATASLAPIAFALSIPLALVDSTLATFAWLLMVPASFAVRWWFGRAARREAAVGDLAEAAGGVPAGVPAGGADQLRPGVSGGVPGSPRLTDAPAGTTRPANEA
ncbi:MAG TPA: TMEM175 family protein [Candidatus Nanopelagicales bacterium]|nr:TMEM175 family protein [Candidatus Nanopelagicales bacterium]